VTLEEEIGRIVREAVRESVEEALDGLDLPTPEPEEEGWRSRVHHVHPDTRLSLPEVAEALDCSPRTVRRYADPENGRPPLPLRPGVSGQVVTAGELVDWIEETESAQWFRRE